MKDSTDGQQLLPTARRRFAEESLEELEHNWIRLRWRLDGAMEEGRMACDAQRKRQVNRGNFSFVDAADPAAGPLRTVTGGVLSPPSKAI